MARRKMGRGDGVEAAVAATLLVLGGLVYYFKNHPGQLFASQIILSLMLVFGAAYALLLFIGRRKHQKMLLNAINSDSRLQAAVDNFIASFGHEQKSSAILDYRGKRFSAAHLTDFQQTLLAMGYEVHSASSGDINLILERRIDAKELSHVVQTMNVNSARSLKGLGKDGKGFEELIARLCEAKGYSSRVIGASGDQGADVIASKNGESIAVQAKYYEVPVGNAAVQQVVAAQAYYGCHLAMVITTSTFTQEARALALSNNVVLIDGDQLQKDLSEFLHESWS